jgi:ATP-dependent Clp protease ATP-binding subunit ClpB
VAQPALKQHFKRDEFLGRINEMVVFHPFSAADLGDIVRLELQGWAAKAKTRHDMGITYTDAVVERLTKGYNERYGFRSIKYEVQRQVVNLLAYAHERNIVTTGCELNLDMEGNRVTIQVRLDHTLIIILQH